MAYDDVKTAKIVMVGVIGAVLIFAVMVLVEVLYYQIETRLHHEGDDQASPEVANQIAQQRAALVAGYSVADAQKKVYNIPVDRAMKLVVRELSRQSAPADDASDGGPHAQ
jgi:ATP/ADP translocase